jgi:hypothetical protein
MAERNVRLIPKKTAVAGRIPTGTTGYEQNYIRQGELALNTTDKKLWSFDGTNVFEIGSNSFLALTGGTVNGNFTVTGDSVFQSMTGTNLNLTGLASSGNTVVMADSDGNLFTASTIDLEVDALDYLYVTSFSAGTIYSGSTNLYDIFLTTADGNDITRVQGGVNITTGGTANAPVINLVSSPGVNNFIASGNTDLNILSADTIYSGSTNLYDIFLTSNDGNDITRIQPGLNIYTGGTPNAPTINVSAATLNYLSATTISGGTIYSGSTDLGDIFLSEISLESTYVGFGSAFNTLSGSTGFTFVDGKVGIGIISPDSLLDVNSIFNVADTVTGGAIYGLNGSIGGLSQFTIAIGDLNYVGGIRNASIGGYDNDIQAGNRNGIFEGFQNTITIGNQNTIVGGTSNQIDNGTNISIFGSYQSTAQTSSDYSAILAGRELVMNGQSSALVAGYINEIQSTASYGVIAGGY